MSLYSQNNNNKLIINKIPIIFGYIERNVNK